MHLLIVSHACITPINQQLYAELARITSWRVTLVVPSSWRDEYGNVRAPARWPAFHGEIIPVRIVGSGNIPLHAYRSLFVRVLRELRPDAVYVHHEPYALATAQVFAAHRAVGRGPIGFYSAQNLLKRYPPPFRWTEQGVLRRAAFAVTVSETVAGVLRAKGFAGEVSISPLGVDPAVHRPSEDADRLRSQLGIHGHELVVGYVGRVAEEKGVMTLLNALKYIEDVPWRLVVVGSGPLDAAFEERASTLGLASRVVRAGFVSHADVPAYLSLFDVLAVPSETRPNWKEQFGRVLIEAWACGTPVIGSDSGEIPHLIAASGGGVTFPEGDAGALSAQLRSLLADDRLRRSLAEAGRSTVLAKFTHETLATSLAETIDRAAGRVRVDDRNTRPSAGVPQSPGDALPRPKPTGR